MRCKSQQPCSGRVSSSVITCGVDRRCAVSTLLNCIFLLNLPFSGATCPLTERNFTFVGTRPLDACNYVFNIYDADRPGSITVHLVMRDGGCSSSCWGDNRVIINALYNGGWGPEEGVSYSALDIYRGSSYVVSLVLTQSQLLLFRSNVLIHVFNLRAATNLCALWYDLSNCGPQGPPPPPVVYESTVPVLPTSSASPSSSSSPTPSQRVATESPSQTGTETASLSASATGTVSSTWSTSQTSTKSGSSSHSESRTSSMSPSMSISSSTTASLTPSSSISPSSSPTSSITASATPSSSWTPSSSPGAYIEKATIYANFSDCWNPQTCLPNGVLSLSGQKLGFVCTDELQRALVATWTAATIIGTPLCSESSVHMVLNITEDPTPWFWQTRSLNASIVGLRQALPITPLPVVLQINTTQIAWRSTVLLTGPGLGVAPPKLIHFTVPGLPDKARCGFIGLAFTNSVWCKLLTVPQRLVAEPLQVALTYSAFSISLPCYFSESGLGRTIATMAAPQHAAATIPKLLQFAGQEEVHFYFDGPVWSIEEEDMLGAPTLCVYIGSFRAPCVFVGMGYNEIGCKSPPGWGVHLHSTLEVGSTNLSIGFINYGPPTVNAVEPAQLWLGPAHENQTVEFSVFLGQDTFMDNLHDLHVSNAPCATLHFDATVQTLFCNIHRIHLDEASGNSPDFPLFIRFRWVDEQIDFPAFGHAIQRPVITSTAPSIITSGGILILFGKNFCGIAGCSSAAGASLSVTIGGADCVDVTRILDTVATCYVPNVDIEAPGYPSFPVVLHNAVGANSSESVLVSYPATAVVRASSLLPQVYLPSDDGVHHFVRPSIEVYLARINVNTTEAYTSPITCTLRALTPTASILSDSAIVQSLIDVPSNATGYVHFGHIAVQTTFSTKVVLLQISCVTNKNDIASANPLLHSMQVDDLVVVWCTTPPPRIQVQATMAPWWVVISPPEHVRTACWHVSNRKPKLPVQQIICTASASATTGRPGTLQGNVAVMDTETFVAVFDAMSIGGQVETDHSISVRCSLGNVNIPSVNTSFTVRIAGCKPGSEPSETICAPCPANFYSNGGNDTCTSCPYVGATCSAGILTLLPGYFRPPSQETARLQAGSELHACGLPNGCFVDTVNGTYGCNEGYTGVLCGVCDTGNDYSLIGSNCVKCLPQTANLALIVVVLVILLIGIGIVVLRRGGARRAKSSIALRILLTHAQAIGSMRAYQISGTEAYKRFMAWTDAFSPAVFSQGPTQCLIRPNFGLVFFATLLAPIIASSSAMLMLGAALIVPSYRAWQRGDSPLSPLRMRLRHRRHLTILFFVCHLAYMPIVSFALSVFNCSKPIDGVRYLVRDLREPCAGGPYLIYASTAGAALLAFGVGFPALLFIIFKHAKASILDDEHFHSAFGFLYDGYRAGHRAKSTASSTITLSSSPSPPAFGIEVSRNALTSNKTRYHIDGISLVWWEAVVLIRKAGIVVIGNLVSDPLSQIGCAIFWNQIFLIAHIKLVPYTSMTFYITEAVSLVVISATASMAVIASNTTSSSPAGIAATVIMITMNVFTLLLLVGTLIRSYAYDYRAHIKKLKKVLRIQSRRELTLGSPPCAQEPIGHTLQAIPSAPHVYANVTRFDVDNPVFQADSWQALVQGSPKLTPMEPVFRVAQSSKLTIASISARRLHKNVISIPPQTATEAAVSIS